MTRWKGLSKLLGIEMCSVYVIGTAVMLGIYSKTNSNLDEQPSRTLHKQTSEKTSHLDQYSEWLRKQHDTYNSNSRDLLNGD